MLVIWYIICGISKHIQIISCMKYGRGPKYVYSNHIFSISLPYQYHIFRYGLDMVVICCRYGSDMFDMLLPGLVLQDMVLICFDMLQIYSDMHIFADMVMIWS